MQNKIEFIGIEDENSWKTLERKGKGTLTVLGHNGLKGNKKSYYLHCSECMKDPELWGTGSISAANSTIQKDRVGCGCCKMTYWSDNQYVILANRILTGSTLKAVDVVRHKGKDAKLILECSICSKDKELWPYGSIVNRLQGLIKGRIPCGCSEQPKWSESQQIVRINRWLREQGSTLTCEEKADKSKDYTYIFTCKVCSKDKELWPYGSILAAKGNLQAGIMPCGCSKTPKWTEPQYKILVGRECYRKGLTFEGWSGDYRGANTKLKLKNNKTGAEWESTILTSFFRDKLKIKADTVYSEEYFIERFKNELGYPEENKFRRFSVDPSKWQVTCAICQKVHIAPHSSLNRGSRSCDCSTGGGFNPKIKGYLYISEWITVGSEERFLKVGITNKPPMNRIKDQINKSHNMKHQLITYFGGDGFSVSLCEKEIMRMFKDERGACSKENLPDGYTETLHYKDDTLEKILKHCNGKGLVSEDNPS